MPEASRPPPWEIVFSHSRPERLHRCLSVPLGGRRVHLCLRCLALCPALALALALRLQLEAGSTGLESPWALRLLLPLLGAALWAFEQGGLEAPRWLRALSGALLGLGLGWVLGRHLREPWTPELLELGGALAGVALLGLLARFRRGRGELEIADELPPEPHERDKIQTDPRKME